MAEVTPTAPHGEMLVDRLLTDPDPLMRKKAAELLVSIDTRRVRGGLRTALVDSDEEVRASALLSLLKLGDADTIGTLCWDLRGRDCRLAEQAARTLGEARVQSAVPAMLDAFRHAEANVAGAIAHALGQIGDPLAVPLLCMTLDHRFVAATAASALGAIGDPRAIAALTRALRRGATPDLRAAAAQALGSIGRKCTPRRAPSQVLAESRVIPALRHAAEDSNRLVRINASIALWILGDRERGEKNYFGAEMTPVSA